MLHDLPLRCPGAAPALDLSVWPKHGPGSLVLALGFVGAQMAWPAWAQSSSSASVQSLTPAPVYESHDKEGPVFSDRPTPGATRVELTTPNLVEAPRPVELPSPATAALPSYRSLAVVSPLDGATIHSNTGSLQVIVRAVPSLRAGTGHRFQLTLDGQVLPREFGASAIDISPSEWAGAAAESAAHTLQLAIIDRQGRVLIEAAPVTFYAHRAAVGHHR